MADVLIRAQVSIPMDSGLPEDEVVQTFYFRAPDGTGHEAAYDAVETVLTSFYGVVDGMFPANVDSPATVKMYDMNDAEPRAAHRVQTIGLTPSAGTPLPSEIALVLSYQGFIGSGDIAARLRGRLYMGPLKNDLADFTGGESRPSAAALDQLAAGGEALLAGTAVGGGMLKWQQYSPTTAAEPGGTQDLAMADVTQGYVDDAWDVQRRRGISPTRREPWDSGTTH